MESTRKPSGSSKAVLVFLILWFVTYLAARAALEVLERGSALGIVAATVPVVPFVGLLWFFFRGVQSADELERRIHLEALALAFPLTLVLLMILGLLDLTIDLSPADWSYRHLWPFAVVFWVAGIALARWRYA